MAEELEIGLQEPENGYDEVLDAVEAASSQDKITWLTDRGRRVAAIVPVDVAEHHENTIAAVLATPVSGPLAEQRQEIRRLLDVLNVPALADAIGTDMATLQQWQNLVGLALTGLGSRVPR